MTTLDQLPPYHVAKIMLRAQIWREQHYEVVKKLLVGALERRPPVNSNIFDPSKWDGYNWSWFSSKLTEEIMQRGRARK